MFDKYNRKINYLRISVTDRCNLRCHYCMPEEGIILLKHREILSFEEILPIVRTGIRYGITKVRITGGEPLVRKNVAELVGQIAGLEGIEDLAMTTNGILLEQYAGDLAGAGLHRINVSLDSMDPEKYREITRGGDLLQVIRGIAAARAAGLNPVKINCVIEQSADEPDARQVAWYCRENGLEIRYIYRMKLEEGKFRKVIGGTGGDCHQCNRLRLTANGLLMPCLFSDLAYDVRKLGAEEAFSRAVGNKPETGTKNKFGRFHNIGG